MEAKIKIEETVIKKEATRGKYIVLEGIDGCGKTTQLELLFEHRIGCSGGRQPIPTREPGSGLVASLPFDARLAVQTGGLNRLTTEYLMQAERVEHLLRVDQLLRSGMDVLSDRSAISGLAYGRSNGIEANLMELMTCAAYGICSPDLVIWIDIPVEEAMLRLKERGKLAAEESYDRLFQVRSLYEFIALRRQPFSFAHIDAGGKSEELIASMIADIVDNYLANEGEAEIPSELKAELYLGEGETL